MAPARLNNELPPAASDVTRQRSSGADTLLVEPYSLFKPEMKICIVVMVSIFALTSPFGATTFLPAINALASDLGVTPPKMNISITSYMVRNTSSSRAISLGSAIRILLT